MATSTGLLVKVSGRGTQAGIGAMAAAGVDAEPILELPGSPAQSGFGIASGAPSTWMRLRPGQGADDNPWDAAHALLDAGSPFAAAGGSVEAAEPDLSQDWPSERQPEAGGAGIAAAARDDCAFDPQTDKGRREVGPEEFAWNLGPLYSQLASARTKVGEAKLRKILIAHLDTGYDPRHITFPLHMRLDLQRSFVEGDPDPKDASDRVPAGAPLANRGHGTGTLSLLAGNRLDGSVKEWGGFADFLGGAPFADILPIRIADWVVRFTTATIVQGIGHAVRNGAHVLSMSMGGFSSQALADAVNLAYDSGLMMVTAAGNNVSGVPTPGSVVFPARFKRVLAACGVMAKGHAYADLGLGTMQGNYGPAEKMTTALGAYTPNVPWAQIGCRTMVDMDGAGTSAATPQIAASAALWLAEHFDRVNRYNEPWMRIEAARHALFTSASKTTPGMDAATVMRMIGQGVAQAEAALAVLPLPETQLVKLPPASSTWGWLDGLFGGGVSIAPDRTALARRKMVALELTQMAQRIKAVDEAIDDPERPAEAIGALARNRYLEAALDAGNPSRPARQFLESLLGKKPPAPATRPSARPAIKRRARKPAVPERRLRVYALDPSVAKSLASLSINQTVLSIPWDDAPLTKTPLAPGPVGEYLEVVDVDPASDRIYEPVDLNDRFILAENGLAPSEGNPQFHQQMVYAVAMTTIRHFEQALGRRALWAPRYDEIDDGRGGTRTKGFEVPRLRLYPHAFRGDNAYYSPGKKAILFGYFPASSRDGDLTAPGSMVFSCLSSDIIAHEMSHALLDGLHRRFQDASNPDVAAFHEAFADIVALFQHFTVADLVRFEIGRARADLSAAGLLSGLARQFGEGASRGGPLRNYADPGVAALRYRDTKEAHDRGSILVYAVYEAFRNIVARRNADLFRLASNGTGVLPEGALHPDLVARLSDETCKVAAQVLRMCIRALDYCPSVDITFGEYLRALITADIDYAANDPFGYRTAVLEAFRNRGILPNDVRTISEESLAWATLDDPQPAWLPTILSGLDLRWDQDLDRGVIFDLNEKNRWTVFGALKKVFSADPSLYAQFGLLPNIARYHPNGSVMKTPAKNQTTFDVFSVRPARRIGDDGSMRTDVVVTVQQRQPLDLDPSDPSKGIFWFRGGATLIIDQRPGHQEIRYAIVKNSGSKTRQERQRQTSLGGFVSPLQALYFGDAAKQEPFAGLHSSHRGLDDV